MEQVDLGPKNMALTLIFPFTNGPGQWTGIGAMVTYDFRRSVYIYSPNVSYDKAAVLKQIQHKGLKGYCIDNLTERECKSLHAALLFGEEKYVTIGDEKPFQYTCVGDYYGPDYPGKGNLLRHLVNRIDHIRIDCEEVYTRKISPVKQNYKLNKNSFHYKLLYDDLKPYWDSSSWDLPNFNVEYVNCSTLQNIH